MTTRQFKRYESDDGKEFFLAEEPGMQYFGEGDIGQGTGWMVRRFGSEEAREIYVQLLRSSDLLIMSRQELHSLKKEIQELWTASGRLRPRKVKALRERYGKVD